MTFLMILSVGAVDPYIPSENTFLKVSNYMHVSGSAWVLSYIARNSFIGLLYIIYAH
jgi:hypothetical protein